MLQRRSHRNPLKPLFRLFQGRRFESSQAKEPRFPRTMVQAVKNRQGTHRVVVYRRSDGCFEYVEEVLDDLEAEPFVPKVDYWRAVEPGISGIYDTPETTLREAKMVIRWLKQQESINERS